MNKKLLVIGLDGMDPRLLEGCIRENNFSFFEKITEEGVSGNLKSTIPPMTCPAWPSFYTGKNPGKHGLYNFKRFSLETSETSFSNLREVDSIKIWNILTTENKKSIIFNVPVTFPPEKINGIMISGFLTPSRNSDFSYPKEIKEKIEKLAGEYYVSYDEIPGNSVDNIIKLAQKRLKIFEFLLKNKQWNFFNVVFRVTDSLLHHSKNWREYKENSIVFLKKFDEKLKEILSNNNLNIFLMSDHGGTYSKRRWFHINNYLEKKGLLKMKPQLGDYLPFNAMKVYNFLLKLGIDLQNILPDSIQEKEKKSYIEC